VAEIAQVPDGNTRRSASTTAWRGLSGRLGRGPTRDRRSPPKTASSTAAAPVIAAAM
jgi:hypothetical protein